MSASWVIRDTRTGEPKLESFDKAKCEHILKCAASHYEIVPILQHLQEINRPGTLVYAWARRTA
jgi:hypothetical protein